MSTPFSPPELERYARHIMLREFGGPGQQALKRARILLIGAGGIGSPAALYLAAAGVGTLGIVDDDTVSLSNLQRQILHATDDIGRSKLDSAQHKLAALNPHVKVEGHAVRLSEANGSEIVAAYDIVLDGSDNFATRYLVADLCEDAKKPLVQAAIERFSGSLTVFAPHLRNAAGEPYPTLRDLFPHAPPPGSVPSCAEAGILGVIAGILGTMAATEAIKLACNLGDPLLGRLLLVDALRMRFEEISYGRQNPAAE
ncbi:molybdopterin-synthase adenylyltransferase MoeB [Aureimonas fodinaquatilis]|uniref:Molybdopterin-synthase adenylyltransferase n=1 Tax=Aureimonas fodinaquatilis TaxID=2565783 RepID=A0A5B0E3B2_9HYPH|nr:molybdopterin-synthase adenylyltransferase MoeB [Aureimonas fodinaquatilis]KAA0972645.1 molybdopterin-synthase adenylyltransferase MoeB [Aureimonas fodinaquatilis]